MTTPSSGSVQVVGVLMDPALMESQNVSPSQTVHETVQSLWKTFCERVDTDPTSETSKASVIQVLLESDLNDPTEATFPALAPKSQTETYIVMFGVPPSWSCVDEVSKGNKENVVTRMANLSITDDEGSRKLTDGSNKPNVPPKPQGIGRQTDTSPFPLTAPPHNNAIESLRQELLGKINGQANDIRALHSSNTKLKLSNDDLKSKVNGLKSSNDELKSSNDELKSKVNGLKSSNDELKSRVNGLTLSNAVLTSKVDGLTSSNAGLTSSNTVLTSSNTVLTSSNTVLTSKVNGLTSSVNGLTSSNVELKEKVYKLVASNTDISSTLQSHKKILHALNRRMVLDDARNKLANEYSFTLDELRPRRSDVGSLIRRIQSKLKAEHAKLLSYDALAMIFDSSDNSIRDDGNRAAHEAPLADRVDSVLEETLTKTQRALLGEIYFFTHGKEPDVETVTNA